MKAALLTYPGVIEIREVSKPVPGPDDLLIKVKRACICGSDNHIYKKGEIAGSKVDLPFILGHEFSGEVIETGINTRGFKKGDRIAVEPCLICGQCVFCRTGRYNLCDNYRFLAAPPDSNGAFCEYIAHNHNHCFLLPDNISYEQGALIEPLSIVIQAFEISNFKIADDILIFGAGSIGLLLLILFKSMGAGRCFITDVNGFKLETAKRLGADFAINTADADAMPIINAATEGKGIAVIIDSVGGEKTLNQGIEVSAKNATIVVIGITDDKSSFDIVQLICKMLVIKGTTDFVNAFPKAINLIKNNKVDVLPVITDTYHFSDIAEAFRNVNTSRNTIKTMIRFD